MTVFGPKKCTTLVQAAKDYFDDAQEINAAQSRSKLYTTLGPWSYWSGYTPAFNYEHGFTPIFVPQPAKLAGREYFHLVANKHQKFWKWYICIIVGLLLVMRDWYAGGMFASERWVRAFQDQRIINGYVAKNVCAIGLVDQMRWAEAAGFPTDEEGPFDATV